MCKINDKRRPMKSLTLTILLFGISTFLTAYSSGQMNMPVLVVLTIIAILGTLATSIWFKGNLKDNLLKVGKIVFPITAIIFLLGYFYDTLRVML